MNGHSDHDAVAAKVRDAVDEAIRGTPWQPPDGGVIVDCVVMVGWFSPSGTYGGCHLRHGTPWGTHGLVEDQLERMDAQRAWENRYPQGDGE